MTDRFKDVLMRVNLRLVIGTAMAVVLGACHPGAQSASGGGDAMTAPEMSLGNPNAKVTVIEYASDTCPHCARFGETVFPAFKAKYVDTGKVRYVFREFLTEPIQVAAAGFLVARCAGKDKYFQVVDAEFRAQNQMFASGDAHGVLLNIAKSAGLTEAQFNACVQNEAALKALSDRVQHAAEVDHIDGTPTLLVNGKKLGVGEVSMAQLDAAIQPLLK
jgi:protein-disulfide isomerase